MAARRARFALAADLVAGGHFPDVDAALAALDRWDGPRPAAGLRRAVEWLYDLDGSARVDVADWPPTSRLTRNFLLRS